MNKPSRAALEVDRLMALHPKGFDLSLERIRQLLERLGNPHERLPPVIHIAGTNGKGSAAAFCRALLEAAGHSVHVHTSPHLVNWHERFRMGAPGGGELVEDELLASAIRRVADANGGAAITVFEILTAAMFVLFSEAPADAAVIEVGLGGRFDATNVIPQPAVSLIMPIALDHEAHLGDRVELIAAEKAGIIKPGAPLVIGVQEHAAAREVLRVTAERLGCPYRVYGEDFFAFAEHGRMIYQDGDGLTDLPLPRLAGRHQLANAAAAITAVRVAGFAIDEAAMDKAMNEVSWPARMQPITSGALLEMAPPGAELWLDGGHNPHAANALAETLAGEEEVNPKPLILICGMLDTKDQTGFFEVFRDMASQVLTVPIRSSDAGVSPDLLAARAAAAGTAATPADSIPDALRLLAGAWRDAAIPPRIVICGSLYLAGEALAINGTPPR